MRFWVWSLHIEAQAPSQSSCSVLGELTPRKALGFCRPEWGLAVPAAPLPHAAPPRRFRRESGHADSTRPLRSVVSGRKEGAWVLRPAAHQQAGVVVFLP